MTQMLRNSGNLTQRVCLSRSSCPATCDATWRPPAASTAPGSWNAPAPCRAGALPNGATNSMAQSQYLSATLPVGVPQQISRQKIMPEGLKTEPWSSFVAPLPSPVNDLFPPMEFQFHTSLGASAISRGMAGENLLKGTVGASISDSMAGERLPREYHSSLPRFPPAPPATSSSEERYQGAHALAFGRRSVGEVRSCPQNQEDYQVPEQQQVQEQGQQLEHVRSLTLDLASTVQELVEMQRKLGHDLQEVKLQVSHNSHDLEEFRSSYARINSLQRSGVRPPPLALASAPSSNPGNETQIASTQPANSIDLHHDMPIPTPASQRSTVMAARNLGYSSAEDMLHNVHGCALESLGSLQDWTARAMQSIVAGDATGSSLCGQTDDQKPSGPLTRV